MKINYKLLVIIVLALFLRIYLLDKLPPGLHRDEASTGYNAFLILKTGQDEYQRSFPLAFEAFGDWKRPINIYLTVPFVAFLGLNTLSVRLPIALLGVLTVYLSYLILLELFKKKNSAYLGALVLTISPWHIFMSRTGLGWNVVGLSFTLLAFWLFLKSFKQEKLLLFSSFFWGLSLFSYASNQIFTPLFILLLFFLYFKKIVKNKYFLASLVIFGLILALFIKTYWPVFKVNSKGSSFINPQFTYSHIEAKRNQTADPNSIATKLTYNKPVVYSLKFVANFVTAISPKTLFFPMNANRAYSLAKHGNLYFIEAIFIIFGLFYLKKIKKSKIALILLAWLVLAFLPAALTIEPRASTRSILALFPLLTFITLGIINLLKIVKSKISQNLIALLLIFIYLLSFANFCYAYFYDFPLTRADAHGFGWKEIVEYKKELNPSQVFVSSFKDQYYIYFLFYEKIQPHEFFNSVERGELSWDGFQNLTSFNNYYFLDNTELFDLSKKDSLFIGKIDYNNQDNLENKWTKTVALPSGQAHWFIQVTK